MVPLFTLTSLLTAALLFLVQPMVARMVLPAFGGSPQVWTTAMLFFQASLLAGYGYTHLATSRLNPRIQPWLQLGLFAAPVVLLPIALAVAPSGRGGLAPSFELLWALTLGVAGPFIVVATSGPLLQRWFSWTDHPRSQDPYFLYAAGNLGSFGGLLAYPFLVEPRLDLEAQARLWTGGYLVAALLLAACAVVVHRRGTGRATPGAGPTAPPTPLPRRRIARWLLLAFVPSSLMLAATAHISTDVAAVPFLWVVPLAAYLLSFTVAFSSVGERALRVATFVAPISVVSAITLPPGIFGTQPILYLQVLLVLVGGLVGHGLLARDRPEPSQLTRFYLIVAVGGGLGGLFNGLVAPLLFPVVFEYGLSATLTLALVVSWREVVVGGSSWPTIPRLGVATLLVLLPAAIFTVALLQNAAGAGLARFLVTAALLLPLVTRLGRSGAVGLGVGLVCILPQAVQLATAEAVERTFFGVHRVVREGPQLMLLHGTTVHGMQDMTSDESRRRATGYYHADEPLGDVMRLKGGSTAVGIIGLGTGGIAAYGEPGQTMVFHEIDPAVAQIAEEHFTYLADSPARVEIVLGDGRFTLQDLRGRYGLLVVDAFTSDAIPVHLLTVEAFRVYLDAIREDGVIAVNVSNRHVDLAPVLGSAAAALGASALIRGGQGTAPGSFPSAWFAIARSPETLEPLRAAGWTEPPLARRPWTDQYSSIWSALRR